MKSIKTTTLKLLFISMLSLFTLHGGNAKSAVYYLDVKMFIQGYYKGNGEMIPVEYCQYKANNLTPNIYQITDVCQVTVELFTSSASGTPVSDTFTGYLHTDGMIYAKFFNLPGSGPYFIGVKQTIIQGALRTLSLFPINISSNSNLHSSYDFSDPAVPQFPAQTKDYYSNSYDIDGCIHQAGPYSPPLISDALYKFQTGDIADANGGILPGDQDGIVESSDYAWEENLVSFHTSGVDVIGDLNGSGGVDVYDFLIMLNSVYYLYNSPYPYFP